MAVRAETGENLIRLLEKGMLAYQARIGVAMRMSPLRARQRERVVAMDALFKLRGESASYRDRSHPLSVNTFSKLGADTEVIFLECRGSGKAAASDAGYTAVCPWCGNWVEVHHMHHRYGVEKVYEFHDERR